MSTTQTKTRPTRVPFSERKEPNFARRAWNKVKTTASSAWNLIKRGAKATKDGYGKLPKIVRYPINFVVGCAVAVCVLYAMSCVAFLIAYPFLLVSELFGTLMYLVAFYGLVFVGITWAFDLYDDHKVVPAYVQSVS